MRLFLFCLSLAATQAFGADFEGVITGKPIASDAGKGGMESMKMYLSSQGVRMEIAGLGGPKANMGGAAFTLTTVWQTSEPGSVYVLNLTNKTYLKHDVSKAQQAASAVTEPPKVEKLGTASFLGHSVQRVKVTFSGGRSQELWVDTSLHFPASALALFGQERGLAQNSPWRALEKAGISGIPLKDLDGEGRWGWEATSVEKKSLPASLFQVPAGYTEAKSPMDMLPPAQQAAMQQQLNNMTPEQRAKVEEAMKKAAQ